MGDSDIPPWVLDGQGANAKSIWEQKVMREIFLTLKPRVAELVILGYMDHDPRCLQLFETISDIIKRRNRK
jgi:hypothetical protein